MALDCIAVNALYSEPLGKDTLLYFNDGSERAFVAIGDGLKMGDVRSSERIALTFGPDQLYLFGRDGRRIGNDA